MTTSAGLARGRNGLGLRVCRVTTYDLIPTPTPTLKTGMYIPLQHLGQIMQQPKARLNHPGPPTIAPTDPTNSHREQPARAPALRTRPTGRWQSNSYPPPPPTHTPTSITRRPSTPPQNPNPRLQFVIFSIDARTWAVVVSAVMAGGREGRKYLQVVPSPVAMTRLAIFVSRAFGRLLQWPAASRSRLGSRVATGAGILR